MNVSLTWFNLSAPWIAKSMDWRIRLWNLHNRVTADGDHWWGFGLLQIGKRHLFYVGDGGVRALFIGQTA